MFKKLKFNYYIIKYNRINKNIYWLLKLFSEYY